MPREPVHSVIIGFYKDARALTLVLSGLARQGREDFEVIVADDGSPRDAFEAAAGAHDWPFPLVHSWHEDRGWRKNEALNRALARSRGSYLLFLDGDCVPHRRWLDDHDRARRPGVLLAGRRVFLSEPRTASLTPEDVRAGCLEAPLALLRDAFRGARHVEKGLRSPFGGTRSIGGVSGCHWSVWREDLLAVNGFDNGYHGPGVGEDTDVEWRLNRHGILSRGIQHRAPLYHLWHPRLERSVETENFARFEARKASGVARCEDGLAEIDSGSFASD